jgi:hypothetical protein
VDLTTCSVYALAGSAGGAIGGYCAGRRRRRRRARVDDGSRAGTAGNRPARRRRRGKWVAGRPRGGSAMRSWPGGAGHSGPPAEGAGGEDVERS